VTPAPPASVTPTPAPPSASSSAPSAADVPTPQVLYVKTHLANFRQGAGTSQKILRVLRQGARLQVLETRTTWLRVRLDDGQEGWVAESVTSATAPVTPARVPSPRGRPSRVAAA
jgi:SH3-like domain-containing protein